LEENISTSSNNDFCGIKLHMKKLIPLFLLLSSTAFAHDVKLPKFRCTRTFKFKVYDKSYVAHESAEMKESWGEQYLVFTDVDRKEQLGGARRLIAVTKESAITTLSFQSGDDEYGVFFELPKKFPGIGVYTENRSGEQPISTEYNCRLKK
jgi:hypothetical protein